MKYQIGDRILILHSGEEGHIIDFIDRKMVMVEVEGITFPVFLDQIDFPYFRDFSARPTVPAPAPPPRKRIEDVRVERTAPARTLPHGLHLSLLPVFDKDVFDEDVVDYFRVSLLNGLDRTLQFHYRLLLAGGGLAFELRNEVRPGTDLYLHDVSLDDMNGSPRFTFDLTAVDARKQDAPQTTAQHRVRAKQLFADIDAMRRRQDAHFTYTLLDEWPARTTEPPPPTLPTGRPAIRPGGPPPPSVVDLHIERLVADTRTLQPFEILDIQLAAFEKAYDAIVAHRQPMLTVIHGVGKGVLRDEIHERLRMKRHVSTFVNQYHPLFGYGATEIHFRY